MLNYPWNEKWTSRNKLVASFINDNASVLDLGGGLNELRQYIKPSKYVSIDLQPYTKETVVADLNKKLPDIGKFDFIVCQGLLEYIENPYSFLKRIKKYGNTLILTYRKQTNNQSPIPRNDYAFKEIYAILKLNKWKILLKKDSVSKHEKLIIAHYN